MRSRPAPGGAGGSARPERSEGPKRESLFGAKAAMTVSHALPASSWRSWRKRTPRAERGTEKGIALRRESGDDRIPCAPGQLLAELAEAHAPSGARDRKGNRSSPRKRR